MSLKSKFSSTVLHAREEAGYTQSAVAQAVSVTVRWYQKVESGDKLPGSVTMLRLLVFLEIDVEVFREEVGLVIPVSPLRKIHVFR